MTDDLPKSIATGTVTVFGVELHVHTLDDGRRIIEADGVHHLLAAMAGGGVEPGEVAELARLFSPRQPGGSQHRNDGADGMGGGTPLSPPMLAGRGL